MKPKNPLLTLILAVFVVSLAACSTGVVPTEPASSPAAPVEPLPMPTATTSDAPEAMTAEPAGATEQPSAAPTPTVDVEALILEKLDGNHSADRVFNAQKTREEWNVTLDRMIGYGAQINAVEKELIINYLLSRQ